MKVTAVTSQPVTVVETTVSKAAETTATTDSVSLSPTARAAAAGGVPLFAVTDTTDSGSIASVADKKKTEQRVKQMEKEAAVLEKQYTDEQVQKLDRADRLVDRTKSEAAKKKENTVRLEQRNVSEDSHKADVSVRLTDRAKDEETQKAQQMEKAVASGDTARVDQLLKRAKDEENKKAQSAQNLKDRSVSEDQQKAATLDRIGKTEAEYKKRQVSRLDSKFVSEADQKRDRITTLADNGEISLTDAKDLLSLVDKNLEARHKELGLDTKDTGGATGVDTTPVDVVKSA